MTRRTKKILITIGLSIVGVIVVLVVAAILILQSSWFQNFVRQKIVAEVEDATGGKVDIGSFQFDWTHLTVRIRDFVLHGTEPATAAPLVRIPLLTVQLKLFSGLYHMIDLAYVGVQQPAVDVIVFPDGKTNIPQPKVQSTSSSNSNGLETIVDLKIGKFDITNGLLQFADQESAFDARGENLHALLTYDTIHPSYDGSLSISPLVLASGTNPPLNVQVNIPVAIEKNGVNIQNASLNTPQSHIKFSVAMQNMNAPRISAQLNADISLPEMKNSLNLPIYPNAAGAPKVLTAQLAATYNEQNKAIQVQTAHLALGNTTFQASGSIQPASNSAVQFNTNLDLAQLTRLLNVTTIQASGNVDANGSATLDAQDNYSVNGTINSRGVSIRSGATRVSNVSLYSPFHADPYLISLDGLRLSAFGGDLAAKIFVEKMQQLSVEGTLRNFSLPVLAAAFTGKHLGYDGTLDGFLKAQGDLKAKGMRGFSAQARLDIVPGHRGVPVSGRLYADYSGPADTVSLGRSYLALPNSRLDLSGTLGQRIDISLVSHNLNDFLPAENFEAKQRVTSLPIALQSGGVANIQAQITGSLSAPHITSHVAVDRFAVEGRSFDRFAADLAASPSGADIRNGLLTRNTMQTTFDASIGLRKWSPEPWSPISADLVMRNAHLADLMSLAGEGSMPATGDVSADVHVNGTYGDPLGSATLQVLNGSADKQPFSRLYANVNLAPQLITLSNVELDTAGGRIQLSGTFRHPHDSFLTGQAQFRLAATGIQLADVKALQQQGMGVAGSLQLTASAAASLQKTGDESQFTISNVSADVAARGLRVDNQSAGDLTATARTANGAVNYKLTSDFAGSNIQINGVTELVKNYPTTANASIQNLSIQKTLAIVGESSLPASGTLSANAHVAGTLQSPSADLSFTLAHANIYQEPVNRLQGSIQYSNTLVNIPSIQLSVPAGTLTLAGSFSHPANDLNAGSITLKLDSSEIQLAKIKHLEEEQPGFSGTLQLAADLSARIADRNGSRTVLISKLDADAAASGLRMNDRNLGGATLNARTNGSNLNFRFDSDIAQSQIHASGVSQLGGDYPVRASLTFSNIKYSNIAPFLSITPETPPSFDAMLAGQASVNGPILAPDDLTARLQLTTLQAQTLPTPSPTGAPARRAVVLHNDGPVVVTLNHMVLTVEQLRITGPDTTITASGAINLKNGSSPLGLTVNAGVDLAVLEDINRDFYSSGSVDLNATIRGSISDPLVNGRIELKNANVEYTQSPNGISNANGVILLQGTSATIQNLTGESGGGKISVTGFAAYTGKVVTYNIRASATKVRVRYSGISIVSNANVRLIGNTQRSLASGSVIIQRIAYGSSGDVGSMLSSASAPPSTPSAPSGIVAGMRLDIHVLTAPDLRVISSYTNRLSILADLTVRGTAANPGILGRVTITDGQLVFFGNTYTVEVGTINFYNPYSIDPVLDISLETIAQNVQVVIGVSGPMNDLKLTYRSDPPLTFEQIVALLATNTTPANALVASQQPTPPQQSFTQMGESAVLGQAVANPLASRVQRVFGLTQFKIDPTIAGPGSALGARVTLQEKIASNITFTYSQDLTQSNAEIVQVQWAFSPTFSAVAMRDFNGNVSLEFFHQFKKR